jgi:hypothetical protein
MPLANSRWSCDSVVRAPMAPQAMRSWPSMGKCPRKGIISLSALLTEIYWGEMVSSSSLPTGTPISLRSFRSCLPILRPLLTLKEPSISGSLMRPFQPTVVRGFCKSSVRKLTCSGSYGFSRTSLWGKEGFSAKGLVQKGS